MVVKRITNDWYILTLKRQEHPSLAFLGLSKREVVDKLKQHLQAEVTL